MRNAVIAFGLPLLMIASLAKAGLGNESRFAVEPEIGFVWQSRNDVQIPNSTLGTRFSLVELVGSGPSPAARVYLTWNITSRHGLRALLAPFSYTERGVPGEPVHFAGAAFQSGLPTEATYKFNSWRLTYHYRIHDGERWRWWIGFTAKIRDAKIRLEQEGVASEDTDVGFVPLLHIRAEWRFTEHWRLHLDLDALAGGPGRAEDLSVKLSRQLGKRWAIAAGYRTLEGGADVESVYNFAWFHYAVVSLVYRP